MHFTPTVPSDALFPLKKEEILAVHSKIFEIQFFIQLKLYVCLYVVGV
jgi:hypothetical protein